MLHPASRVYGAGWRPGASGLETWSYDGNGNLLRNSEEGATTVYTYSASQPNELLQQHTDGHGVEFFGYDQHGNTTSITSTDSQTQPVTSTYVISDALSYDAQSRPITLTLKDAVVTMGYNAQGQRNSYTVTPRGQSQPSLTMQFRYRDDVVGQVVVSGTQRYTDTYLYTPTDAPLELLRQQGGTTSRYWYILDGRGNVVALTDASGSVVDRYSYDLWGEPESASETVPQQLRYNGYWYDSKLGWSWLDGRSYDPEGRFLQPDPSELDGVRSYVYATDDPVDAADLGGLGCVPAHHWWEHVVNGVCWVAGGVAGGVKRLGQAAVHGVAVVAGGVGALAHGAYNLVVGDDLQILTAAHTSGARRFLAILDLGSTILTLVPVFGEGAAAARLAVKAVVHAGEKAVARELNFKEAVDLAKALRRTGAKEARTSCLTHCFAAGTLVATPRGLRAIQALHVGDHILAEEMQTGQVEAEPVQAVIQDPVSPLMAIDLSDGSVVTVTADHPFWVDAGVLFQGPGWLMAGQLWVGDHLRTAGHDDVVVVGLRRQAGRAVAYTLTVAHDHTFFVGAARVLVHNCAEPLFHAGKEFERYVETPFGQVGILARTEVQGETAVLKNGAIYAMGQERIVGGMQNVVIWRSLVKSLAADAKAQGFRYLRLEGIRVPGSSSANPGRIVDLLIDAETGHLAR